MAKDFQEAPLQIKTFRHASIAPTVRKDMSAVSRLGRNQAHVHTNTRCGGLPGLFEGGVEHQFTAGRGAEPGVFHQFLFQLAGFPAGVAQTDQRLLRSFADGDGFQNIAAGSEHQAVAERHAGLPVGGGSVQHETGLLLYRTASNHPVPLRGRHFDVDVHVAEDIAQADLHGAVEGQPHGALATVLDEIGDGMFEVGVGHLRHGHQQLVFEGRVVHGDSIRGGWESCKRREA